MYAHQQEEIGATLATGTCLGKYRVVRLVGEGGMGAVYEGVHLEIGKRVAIKTMNPELAAIPDARARFLREAQLTSRVRHPHAVDITDVGSEAGHTYLVMEFLEGEDLARHIERRGPMALDETADIMLPVLAAVTAAHDEGIIHRDLKPQNIFLSQTRDGAIVPKVLDFGISKGPSELQPTGVPGTVASVVKTVGLMGSPGYVSPEQIAGTGTVSAASDQYGLGIILYECATGRPPFEGDDIPKLFADILEGKYTPAGQHRPDLPEGFQRIIERAMSLNPADRFPSMRAMGNALLAFASPKTLLAWGEYFGEGARVAMASDAVAPAVAAAAEGAQAESAAVAAAAAAEAPAEPGSQPSITIPRQYPTLWVVAGLALVAALATLAWWKRGAAAWATPTIVTPPPVVSPAMRRIAIPAEAPASVETPAATEEPAGEPTPRAQTARRARFGANRAPLIE
jgi:tRNA A-37 threonylcarbamoyl transferase component Bud32